MPRDSHRLVPSLASVGFAVFALAASAHAQIHVDPAGSDLGAGTFGDPFLTINHAAMVASAGSTIFVHAGTYGDEQGIVQLGTKDLVLQGDGAAITTLQPHATATIALAPADPNVATPLAHRVGILFAGAARVHLRDLTIDAQGFAPASGQLAGLYLRGGVDVVCDHVAVRDCRPTALGGGRANAVVVRGDAPTDPSTLSARDGSFTGFADAGVAAMLRAEIDLQECEIAGLGPAAGPIDQVGVSIAAEAVGAVRLTRIADCGGSGGAAMRLRNHNPGCIVEANRIARAAVGIDVQRSPAALVPASIRDNRIAHVDTTIRVVGALGMTIAHNSLSPVSRFDAVPYYDDSVAGNAWSANRFPVAEGTAAVAIPGGANVDNQPQPGISEFQDRQRVACGGSPTAVVVADLDGDLHDDFATLDLRGDGVGISVGLWRATGHVVSSFTFGGNDLQPVALVAGRFDGAPGIDLVALTAPRPPAFAGAAFWVFGNDGAGALSLLHQQDLIGYTMPAALANASFNANAVDDLVVLDRGALPFVPGRGDTFLNDGTGTVWFPTPLPFVVTESLVAAAAADIDGDTKIDLAIAEGSPSSGRVHWLRGNGVGFFAPFAGSPLVAPAHPLGVTLADFDRDGDRDLLVAAGAGPLLLQRGALQVFDNLGGALAAGPVFATDLGPTRVVAADLDSDEFDGTARPELLVLDLPAGVISLFGAYEHTTGFVGGGLATLVDLPVDFAVSDVDGDEFPDLVVAEPMQGGVALLHGSPTALVETFGRGCPGIAGREPRLETRGMPGLPTQPNTTLQVGLVDGLPLSFAVYALAIAPAPALVPCNYLLDFSATFATWIALTDAQGRTAINLPLPGSPDVRGLPMYFQAGVYDAAAATSFFVGFSLTAGLRLRVGD